MNLMLGVFPQADTLLARQAAGVTPLVEPGFCIARFQAAVRFYQNIGYPYPYFTVCNDATALRAAVTCRLTDNVLLGMSTLADLRCPNTMAEIEALAVQHGIATQVDVLLLNPLDPLLPSFVLAVFPQSGHVNARVIATRWAIADDCLAFFGAIVLAHGSDGDEAHMRAMKERQHVPSLHGGEELAPSLFKQPRDKVFGFSVPDLHGGADVYIAAPARLVPITVLDRTINLSVPNLHFQDPSHLLTKLRAKFLSQDGHGFRLGHGRASPHILKQLTTHSPTAQHLTAHARLGIRHDDLNPRDVMNVPAMLRVIDTPVLEFLQAHHNAQLAQAAAASPPPHSQPAVTTPAMYLRMFLVFVRCAVLSFLDNLAPLVRLRHAWYARYFAMGWRADCAFARDLQREFITPNQFSCVMLNAESLLLHLLWLRSDDCLRDVPFAPHGFGSQQLKISSACCAHAAVTPTSPSRLFWTA